MGKVNNNYLTASFPAYQITAENAGNSISEALNQKFRTLSSFQFTHYGIGPGRSRTWWNSMSRVDIGEWYILHSKSMK